MTISREAYLILIEKHKKQVFPKFFDNYVSGTSLQSRESKFQGIFSDVGRNADI